MIENVCENLIEVGLTYIKFQFAHTWSMASGFVTINWHLQVSMRHRSLLDGQFRQFELHRFHKMFDPPHMAVDTSNPGIFVIDSKNRVELTMMSSIELTIQPTVK
jgi:hypothetical protein